MDSARGQAGPGFAGADAGSLTFCVQGRGAPRHGGLLPEREKGRRPRACLQASALPPQGKAVLTLTGGEPKNRASVAGDAPRDVKGGEGWQKWQNRTS